MYYYMDMPFESESIAKQRFGSIKMFYRNNDDRLGGLSNGVDIRLRSYVLLSTDYAKLSNITNAADGSKAIEADTGKVYILCDSLWREWTGTTDALSIKWEQL